MVKITQNYRDIAPLIYKNNSHINHFIFKNKASLVCHFIIEKKCFFYNSIIKKSRNAEWNQPVIVMGHKY